RGAAIRGHGLKRAQRDRRKVTDVASVDDRTARRPCGGDDTRRVVENRGEILDGKTGRTLFFLQIDDEDAHLRRVFDSQAAVFHCGYRSRSSSNGNLEINSTPPSVIRTSSSNLTPSFPPFSPT